MNPKDPLDELSVEELERLLEEKRRRAAQRRATASSPRQPTWIPQPVGPRSRQRVDPRISAAARASKALTLRSGLARLRDRLLLLVELGALLALIYLVYSSLSELQVLNREVAEARRSASPAQPLASPVALLPASSSPPPGYVPAPYRSLLGTSAEPVVIPTPGPRQAVRIVIPAIGVDAPVVEGDGWEELKAGIGHHIGSANPGERGNMVLSGHNDVYGEVFRYLEKLQPGDEVIVYAQEGAPYRYRVRAQRVVEPSEVSVMEPSSSPTLTLITCHPYLIDTHRMVVFAELVR